MNYLAFDIEAANGYNPASICSIGIVISNENFDVLRKDNLWINPRSKYNLNGTRPNIGIDLHLDKALLDRSPDFAARYREIKALLTAPDTLVIGHAVDSDVRMLNAACKKYRLPCIDFRFICTQLLYKCYKNDKNVMGLDKIADELGLTFQQHFSDEDAYMSLMTLRFLCKSTGKNAAELMELFHVRYGENRDFEMTRPVSLDGQISKKKITQLAVENIKREVALLKKSGARKKGGSLCGKTCALSRDLEIADHDVWQPIVAKIVAEGGEYTPRASKCDVYFFSGGLSETSNMREKFLKTRVERGDAVEFADAKAFLAQ